MNSNVFNPNSMSQTSSIKSVAKLAGSANASIDNSPEANTFQRLLSNQMQPADGAPTDTEINAEEAQAIMNEIEGLGLQQTLDTAQLLQHLGITQQIKQNGAESIIEKPIENIELAPDSTNIQMEGYQSLVSKTNFQNVFNSTQTSNQVDTISANKLNQVNTATDFTKLTPTSQSAVATENQENLQENFSEVFTQLKLESQQQLEQRTPIQVGDTQKMQIEAAIADISKQESGLSIPQNAANNQLQTSVTSNPITQPIIEYPGKSGWDQAISQRVMMMVNNAQQSATISLNPPELGPLEIVISVNNEQADTTFLSDRKEVRQALQDGMDNLRTMMKESGIALGQTNIGARDQQQSQSQQSSLTHESKPTIDDVKNDSKQERTLQMMHTVRSSLGNVDTYV